MIQAKIPLHFVLSVIISDEPITLILALLDKLLLSIHTYFSEWYCSDIALTKMHSMVIDGHCARYSFQHYMPVIKVLDKQCRARLVYLIWTYTVFDTHFAFFSIILLLGFFSGFV